MAYSLLNMLSMKIDLWVFAELANTHILSSVGRANGLVPEISVQSHWLANVPRSLWALPMCTRLPQCLESIGDGSFHFEWENGQPFFCCILLYQIKHVAPCSFQCWSHGLVISCVYPTASYYSSSICRIRKSYVAKRIYIYIYIYVYIT